MRTDPCGTIRRGDELSAHGVARLARGQRSVVGREVCSEGNPMVGTTVRGSWAAPAFPSGVLDGAGGVIQPEKRLMAAVLEGAVSDFQKYATASSGRGRWLFAEVDAWFASTATAWPLDFESICEG